MIICRGDIEDKTKYFVTIMNKSYNNEESSEPDDSPGTSEDDHKLETVYYDEPRFKRAIRLMIYFSTILPSKFMNDNT